MAENRRNRRGYVISLALVILFVMLVGIVLSVFMNVAFTLGLARPPRPVEIRWPYISNVTASQIYEPLEQRGFQRTGPAGKETFTIWCRMRTVEVTIHGYGEGRVTSVFVQIPDDEKVSPELLVDVAATCFAGEQRLQVQTWIRAAIQEHGKDADFETTRSFEPVQLTLKRILSRWWLTISR